MLLPAIARAIEKLRCRRYGKQMVEIRAPGAKEARSAYHFSGGCQCGQVRYAITGPLLNPHICHCRMCQKAFGNYFAAFVSTARENFRWSRGNPGIFRSSSIVSRYFCSTCGTPLAIADDDSKHIAVAIGSLDNPAAAAPERQYGIEAMQPAFATLPTLPGTRTEDNVKPEDLEKLKSLQHPDHDTDHWP